MNKTPVWMTVLIVIVALPALATPFLINNLPADAAETVRMLTGIYPFYMLLSGWLAWKAYPQRSYVSWVLVAVMLLSTLAVVSLVTYSINPPINYTL